MATIVENTASARAPNPVKIDVGEDPSLEKQHESLVKRAPGGVVKTAQMQATSESTIADLTRSENLLDSITVSPVTETGAVLAAYAVSPLMHRQGAPTRMSYVAKLFKFWRGIISLNFVFTKTILQQMKLSVTYVPGATVETPPPTKEELTQMSHRRVINPANEMEVEFDIPFVSTQPFLDMDQSTGMIYVQLFQAFTGSTDPDAIVAIDIFLSSDKLEMFEFAPIPDDNTYRQEVPLEWLFLYSETSDGQLATTNQQDSQYYFMSDSGAQIFIKNIYVLNADPAVEPYTVGCVIAAQGFAPPSQYDPGTCRTLYGDPRGYKFQLRTVCVKSLVSSTTGNTYCAFFDVCFGPYGAFMKRESDFTGTLQSYYGPISEVGHNFSQDIFVVASKEIEEQRIQLDDMRREIAGLRELLLEHVPQNRCGSDDEEAECSSLHFEEMEQSVVVACCKEKIGYCELPCMRCGCRNILDPFNESGCDCEQHYCKNNPHPGVIVLKEKDLYNWVIFALGQDLLEPNQFLDYPLDEAVFGELLHNPHAVMAKPTALMALYFDKHQMNQNTWEDELRGAVISWSPCTSEAKLMPFFLAKVWYLYSRVAFWKQKFSFERFDGLIRVLLAEAFMPFVRQKCIFVPRYSAPVSLTRVQMLDKVLALDDTQ